MNIITRLLPNLLNRTLRLPSTILTNSFHGLPNNSASVSQTLVPGGFFTMAVRNKIRCYFPRPSERKRIKRHGFWKRMSTLEGRRVLMRRILKGRHVLSH